MGSLVIGELGWISLDSTSLDFFDYESFADNFSFAANFASIGNGAVAGNGVLGGDGVLANDGALDGASLVFGDDVLAGVVGVDIAGIAIVSFDLLPSTPCNACSFIFFLGGIFGSMLQQQQ